MPKKITIGRKDKADLPDLKLKNIDLKVDTGAYTSAIHCHRIEVREEEGREVLHFTLLDPTHKKYDNCEFTTDRFREKSIRSSSGVAERRYIIETRIRVFGQTSDIEFSLSERGEMRFPILLGRKFLMGKFVVDTALYNLSYKEKVKKIRSRKKL